MRRSPTRSERSASRQKRLLLGGDLARRLQKICRRWDREKREKNARFLVFFIQNRVDSRSFCPFLASATFRLCFWRRFPRLRAVPMNALKKCAISVRYRNGDGPRAG